jgi:hyperosmotically inducible protein
MQQIIRKLALASSIALTLGGIGTSLAADPKPNDTISEQIVDARRETQILTSFSMNPHLHAFDLTVMVDGNKAVLDGKVDDEIGKDLAERIASAADGIKHVDNRIVVDANYTGPKHAASDRSFGEKVDDATITASVKSKLLWNSTTDGLNIHVDTNNGKVTLTGSARNSAEKDLAARITRDTDGVVGLSNEIVLGSKPDATAKVNAADAQAERAVSDTWITSKVKSSLMFTRGVDSFDIAVTTLDGVVSLTGVVDSTAERELAVRVTRDIRGVKKVDADGLKVG